MQFPPIRRQPASIIREWGPEHAFFKDSGRVRYETVTDREALAVFKRLAKLEGIIPALESSHALAYLEKLMPSTQADDIVVVCLSGRGDKDVQMVSSILGGLSCHA